MAVNELKKMLLVIDISGGKITYRASLDISDGKQGSDLYFDVQNSVDECTGSFSTLKVV